jgi:hypothetical protein
MSHSYPTAWKCPHCGFVNQQSAEVPHWFGGMVLATCDVEAGGCDRPLVVGVEVKVFATARKIEGIA